MITLDVHLVFLEEVLGTASSDPKIHERFIASKAPDAPSLKEEVEALGTDEVEERAITRFPRTEDGRPMLWDYQVKGFFKDACGMLRKGDNCKSAKLRAYKKEIDGLVFPTPRRIVLHVPDGMDEGSCQRPLRASGPQGERVALANSEALPEGTWCDFKVSTLKADLVPLIVEWLQYGFMRGIGQWRNSGKGRFACRVTDEKGKVVFSNLD